MYQEKIMSLYPVSNNGKNEPTVYYTVPAYPSQTKLAFNFTLFNLIPDKKYHIGFKLFDYNGTLFYRYDEKARFSADAIDGTNKYKDFVSNTYQIWTPFISLTERASNFKFQVVLSELADNDQAGKELSIAETFTAVNLEEGSL